jgi:hypothetical protein
MPRDLQMLRFKLPLPRALEWVKPQGEGLPQIQGSTLLSPCPRPLTLRMAPP